MINSYISQDEFVLLIVLREYDDIKEEIKNLNTLTVYQRIMIHYKTILSYCLKYRKNTESKNPNIAKTKKGRCFHQNVQCVAVKFQNLSKNKKQKGCYVLIGKILLLGPLLI